jgi:hypothetical protein
VLERGYGTEGNAIEFLGLRVSERQTQHMQNSAELRFDRVRQPAWTYSGGNYSFYSYTKPGLLLHTLEGLLGRQTMARIMRTYHERWRFRHPSSDDFYAVANEVSGRDLTWYFRQAVEGHEVLDYEVARVSSVPVRASPGYFDMPKGRTLTSTADANRQEEAAPPDARGRTYTTNVIVRRRGNFVFPVVLGLKFEGKPLERVEWDGQDAWKRFRFERAERLEWAEVDPDRKVSLDANRLNNGRRVEADTRSTTYWFSRALFWYQNALALVGW